MVWGKNMENLGVTIRKRRKELNLTQGEVAGIYMSVAKLSNIENGKIIPDSVTLRYLQEKLHLPDLDSQNYARENIVLLMDQGKTYLQSNMLDKALEKFREAESKSSKTLLLPVWAEAKEQIITVYAQQRNYDAALIELPHLDKYYADIGNSKGQISCLIKLGFIYYFKERHKDSYNCYHKALELCDDVDDISLKGKLYYNLANTCFELYDWYQASYFCDKAIMYWKNAEFGLYIMQAMILDRAGISFLAKEKLEVAKNMALESKNNSALGKVWHIYGDIEMTNGNYQTSLDSYKLSIELKKLTNDFKGLARSYSRLALLNLKLNMPDEALEMGNKAVLLSRKHHLERDEMVSLEHLAQVFIARKEFHKAIDSLNKASLIAKKYSINYFLKELYEKTALLFDDLGDKEKCLNYLYKMIKI